MNIHERAKNSRAMKWASRPIYEACKKASQNQSENLTEEQKRIVSKFVLEGKLNGMELAHDDVLKSVMFQITQRQTEYSQKLEVRGLKFAHLKINICNVLFFYTNFTYFLFKKFFYRSESSSFHI